MPLIITMAAFAVVFALEALEEIAADAYEKRALKRHEAVEHKPKRTTDTYVDQLG